MTRPHVVIVGGGLAGMAAAEALSRLRPEFRLTLIESKRILGGRAGSYVDPQTDHEVDYCQHVAMGCCTNLIDLLERCDLQSHLRRFDELTFLHPEYPPSRFAPGRFLPPPLHLLGAINAQRYLSPQQKREIRSGLWKLMRTSNASLRTQRAKQWLTEAQQSDDAIRDFWDVILVSALGEQTDRVSMAAARKVIIEGFAVARGASDVLVPRVPLADLFGRMLAGVLASRGVAIISGRPVQQITPTGGVVTSNETLQPDAIICAVPWHQIAKLFRQWPQSKRGLLPDVEAISQIPASPISGLHLWFDSPITDLDHAVMVGTVSQWLFRNPCVPNDDVSSIGADPSDSHRSHYYQIVISASGDATAAPKQDLVETVLAELRHAFEAARGATLLRHRLVTDPYSVFSLRPEVETVRPPAATKIPWLTLAGDWTKTDWPATMEGAVISGRLAAQTVESELCGRLFPASRAANAITTPGLTPGKLARWLIRRD